MNKPFKVTGLSSRSLLPENINFNLKYFSKPFCDQEPNEFKRYETINFKSDFWRSSKSFNKSGKVLFISGPARNGNHLMMSLCDGQKQMASLPGEDFLLREFLSRVKEDEAEALKSLRSKNNIDYILKMSGAYFDKWKRLDYYIKRSFKPKLWSGQQPINKSHVTDFQDLLPPIKYKEFKNYLISKNYEIKNSERFFDFFLIYLKALNILCGRNDIESYHIFPYLYAYSGLRRELFYFFKNTTNVFCLSPIRRFETFYFSYAKSRYKTTEIRQDIYDELWEHWRHKTIDYLLLKQKYPNKIHFIKYEDMVNNPKKILNKISNKLGLKYEFFNTMPTTLGLLNKGNSSFAKSDIKKGQIYKDSVKNKFPKNILPKEYFRILSEVHKQSL